MIESDVQKIVDQAITSRRSIRAFLPTPVARNDIEAILGVAARAPSGTNAQPWKVYVLTGDSKQRLTDSLMPVFLDPAQAAQHREEYPYYPEKWVPPYVDRRRKVGWDLYALLELTRDDKQGMRAQHARNYRFFDAPVGLIFTIDRVLERGSLIDYGMFLANIMIAARARGLDTCPQAAFTHFHRIIREQLDMPEQEMVVCGMSLGYADESRIENSLVSEREPVAGFTKFLD
ncbi:nitroreductase [Lacisediminimonas sp.]|uniref:nitroreductase n=1 Tax=Lacisediminimonas sp. TaxID=3060582 RepID=UPI0027203914|nr:nitroreductase [Lacisediminimonas sp.]MDO8301540.1 nitroreductase [Lacisediminimonas sp.]MDO9215951.1 nitroreductase [Lacisediminimonas sp.]